MVTGPTDTAGGSVPATLHDEPRLRWSWPDAARGLVYAVPAAVTTAVDPPTGVPLALGVLPACLLPLPDHDGPARSSRSSARSAGCRCSSGAPWPTSARSRPRSRSSPWWSARRSRRPAGRGAASSSSSPRRSPRPVSRTTTGGRRWVRRSCSPPARHTPGSCRSSGPPTRRCHGRLRTSRRGPRWSATGCCSGSVPPSPTCWRQGSASTTRGGRPPPACSSRDRMPGCSGPAPWAASSPSSWARSPGGRPRRRPPGSAARRAGDPGPGCRRGHPGQSVVRHVGVHDLPRLPHAADGPRGGRAQKVGERVGESRVGAALAVLFGVVVPALTVGPRRRG